MHYAVSEEPEITEDLEPEYGRQPTEEEVRFAVEKFRAGRVDMARLMGLSREEVEGAYQAARNMLRNGAIKPAQQALEAIALIRPTEPRYIRALGLAYHYNKQLPRAFWMYVIALQLDPTDTITRILWSEAALTVMGKEACCEGLKLALSEAKETRDNKPYIDRARKLLAFVSSSAR